MTHEEAIARVLRGDAPAYEAVVAGFHRPLRAFVARFCPDPHRGDDIAQRAFVWAYEHLREYQAGTHFAAWLKGIARTLILSELEREEREDRNRRHYLAHLEATRLHQNLSGPDDTEARSAALRECLETLPGASRELVDQRYRRQVPLDQIARAGGSSEGGIKMALLRIRQTLRRCIEGKLGVPLTAEARRES